MSREHHLSAYMARIENLSADHSTHAEEYTLEAYRTVSQSLVPPDTIREKIKLSPQHITENLGMTGITLATLSECRLDDGIPKPTQTILNIHGKLPQEFILNARQDFAMWERSKPILENKGRIFSPSDMTAMLSNLLKEPTNFQTLLDLPSVDGEEFYDVLAEYVVARSKAHDVEREYSTSLRVKGMGDVDRRDSLAKIKATSGTNGQEVAMHVATAHTIGDQTLQRTASSKVAQGSVRLSMSLRGAASGSRKDYPIGEGKDPDLAVHYLKRGSEAFSKTVDWANTLEHLKSTRL